MGYRKGQSVTYQYIKCKTTFEDHEELLQHLEEERRAENQAAATSGVAQQFCQVLLYSAPCYYIFAEFPENATLKDVDTLLRRAWMENCCGHMSMFQVDTGRPSPMMQLFQLSGRSMDGLSQKMIRELTQPQLGQASKRTCLAQIPTNSVFEYEYDMGSTTNVRCEILSRYQKLVPRACAAPTSRHHADIRFIGETSFEIDPEDRIPWDELRGYSTDYIRIVARNMKPYWNCDRCRRREASLHNSNTGKVTCQTCHDKMPSQDTFMEIFNSPRTGICGYEGPVDNVPEDASAPAVVAAPAWAPARTAPAPSAAAAVRAPQRQQQVVDIDDDEEEEDDDDEVELVAVSAAHKRKRASAPARGSTSSKRQRR